jgi:hypothetical protein
MDKTVVGFAPSSNEERKGATGVRAPGYADQVSQELARRDPIARIPRA